MRQLLQLRLKTKIYGQTGSFQPVGNYVNPGKSEPPPLRAIQGWTGNVNCAPDVLETQGGQPITTEGGDPITV